MGSDGERCGATGTDAEGRRAFRSDGERLRCDTERLGAMSMRWGAMLMRRGAMAVRRSIGDATWSDGDPTAILLTGPTDRFIAIAGRSCNCATWDVKSVLTSESIRMMRRRFIRREGQDNSTHQERYGCKRKNKPKRQNWKHITVRLGEQTKNRDLYIKLMMKSSFQSHSSR